MGFQARAALVNFLSESSNSDKRVITEDASTVLWLEYPAERFLLIVDAITAETLVEKLCGEAELNNGQQWPALDTEAGIPVIDTINSAQFILQATNLQALGGINSRKGCYTGQEMVAHVKFRGVSKRVMWALVGVAGRVPEAGEDLEPEMGEDRRRTGTVSTAVQLADGQILVQVVTNNDMEADSVFRVREDARTLHIISLPYSLGEGQLVGLISAAPPGNSTRATGLRRWLVWPIKYGPDEAFMLPPGLH